MDAGRTRNLMEVGWCLGDERRCGTSVGNWENGGRGS